MKKCLVSHKMVSHPPTTPFMAFADSQMDDMDVDLDKEFLQDLKELKVLVADKDLLDLHKR